MTREAIVDGQIIAVPDGDAQHVPQPPAVSVPQVVSALAAKLALQHANLLASVTSAIQSAGGDALIWFDSALHWERQNAFVLQFATALNLTSDQVDALFVAAGVIDAANA